MIPIVQSATKVREKKKLLAVTLGVLVLGVVLFVLGCYMLVDQNKKYVRSLENSQHMDVGIVLGAGISKDGKPYDELKARLDVAAEALSKGVVQKLILSGDNRFENYDEPSAMKRYVQDKGIASDKLVRDYAGRSTYESCERASKVFGVKKAIIFSAHSHLPRAIYLCRHFGVEAFGVGSGLEANNSSRREPLARVKAVYNIYIAGEPTVLGDPISLD